MNQPQQSPPSKKRIRLGEWTAAIVLLSLLTWFLLWPAFQNVRDSWSADDWPVTEATVTKATKSKRTDGNGKTSISYRFRYEYQVGEQTYTGWRYSLRYPGGNQSTGVQLHRQGQIIAVHYHPDHPERSAIDIQSSPWWNYLVLGVSLAITIVLALASLNRQGEGGVFRRQRLARSGKTGK